MFYKGLYILFFNYLVCWNVNIIFIKNVYIIFYRYESYIIICIIIFFSEKIRLEVELMLM